MLQNKEGEKIPSVTFRLRKDNAWECVTSDDFFRGKTIVLFALPGAYTPTCSSAHLPRYNELAETFRKQGVDKIACLSVNDSFVLNAWAADERADQICFLPDASGEFSQAMGMLVDKTEQGLGKRSWRYSMLVRDGVIEKMFIEEQGAEDPYRMSDADTMLRYLNPNAKPPARVTMFSNLAAHTAPAHDRRCGKLVMVLKISLWAKAASATVRCSP